MEFLNYFLALLLAYLGPVCGAALAYIAPEELEPGKKYFLALERMLLFVIAAIILYFYKVPLIVMAGVLCIVGGSLWIIGFRKMKPYLALAVLLYLSSYDARIFFLEAAVIFLYGLPVGTLIAADKIKQKKRKTIARILLDNAGFLLIGIMMWALARLLTT